MRNAIVCVLTQVFLAAVFGYYFTKIVIDDNKEGDETIISIQLKKKR